MDDGAFWEGKVPFEEGFFPDDRGELTGVCKAEDVIGEGLKEGLKDGRRGGVYGGVDVINVAVDFVAAEMK